MQEEREKKYIHNFKVIILNLFSNFKKYKYMLFLSEIEYRK